MSRGRVSRRLWLGIVVVLTLGLAVSAMQGVASAQSASKTPTPDLNATVRVVWVAGFRIFDPLASTQTSDMGFLNPIYDHLLTMNSKGALEPQIASAWTWADERKTLTLTVHTGQFQDGTPLNAQAVAANLTRAIASTNAPVQAIVKNIASVTAPDATTVVIKLKEADPLLLTNLASNWMGIASPAAFATLQQRPVGSGPFELTAVETSKVTYRRFANYWDKSAKIAAGLEVNNTADYTAMLNGLRTGSWEAMAWTNFDSAPVHALEKDPDYQVAIVPAIRPIAMFLNLSKGPLANPDVRRALNYGIDRQSISEFSGGMCSPTTQPLPVGPGSVNALDKAYKYNPTKAKSLLEKAGASNLTLKGMVPNVPGSDPFETSVLVQNQLKQIGVTLTLERVVGPQVNFLWAQGNYEAMFNAQTPEIDQAAIVQNRFLGVFAPGNMLPAAQQPLAQKIFSTSQGTPERTAAVAAFNRAQVGEPTNAYVCAKPPIFFGVKKLIGLDKMPYSSFITVADASRLLIAKTP